MRTVATSDLTDQLQTALGTQYTVERELGRGGMATVYLAKDAKHHRSVAIKVLHADLATSLGSERFRREITVAAKLQHPHILTVLDSGETPGGLLWFTMPYVEGESLRGRLRRQHQLPLDDALRITREVALALDYAHRQGVIHRDIKPENILLVDGQAMIVDFGIARALGSAGPTPGATLTETGYAIGTPAYMSPEQAAGERSLDGTTDVYALGAVLYEMLVGELPYAGPTAQAIVAKMMAGDPPSVRRTRPTVPAGVDAAVHKALAPVPADRYATAALFASALDTAERTASAPVVGAPAGVTASPAASRRRIPVGAALLGLGVLIGGGVLFAWRHRESSSPMVRSIAVLPTDIGADTAHAFLADGLSSDLTTKLSKIPGLSVRAYSSSRVMRGRTVREAGKELGVGAVLTVNMARSGATLRATASLVNAATDDLLWSEAFEASNEDQFALQDKLVTAIAGALNLSLSAPTTTAVRARGTRSNEAHELVQRSRFEVDQFTAASLRSAVSLAEAAIAIDSTYADAWAALAWAWAVTADNFVSAATAGPQMRRAAERALALDPTLADAHAEMGAWWEFYGHDPAAASREMEQALALDSANVNAGTFGGFLLRSYLHLPDSANAVAQRAERLNPLSFAVWTLAFLPSLDFTKLSPDSARAICTRAALIQERLAALCEYFRDLSANDRRAAAAAIRRYHGPTPSGGDLADLAGRLLTAGDTSGARDALRQALALANTEYVREDYIAEDYQRLGDRERAIQWWVKGGASNVARLIFLPLDSFYNPIRSDPRIQAIIQRSKVR